MESIKKYLFENIVTTVVNASTPDKLAVATLCALTCSGSLALIKLSRLDRWFELAEAHGEGILENIDNFYNAAEIPANNIVTLAEAEQILPLISSTVSFNSRLSSKMASNDANVIKLLRILINMARFETEMNMNLVPLEDFEIDNLFTKLVSSNLYLELVITVLLKTNMRSQAVKSIITLCLQPECPIPLLYNVSYIFGNIILAKRNTDIPKYLYEIGLQRLFDRLIEDGNDRDGCTSLGHATNIMAYSCQKYQDPSKYNTSIGSWLKHKLTVARSYAKISASIFFTFPASIVKSLDLVGLLMLVNPIHYHLAIPLWYISEDIINLRNLYLGFCHMNRTITKILFLGLAPSIAFSTVFLLLPKPIVFMLACTRILTFIHFVYLEKSQTNGKLHGKLYQSFKQLFKGTHPFDDPKYQNSLPSQINK
ncbi:hypothetical protein DFA_00397 [Cavenderia fasciculata]|uniref:Transmembrane protein n=1 Tax=Cavenderia fasciculata TaxID=261658 RepID=F4PRN7_CACFS|nr:uncharacterized protein DFA_00397 [Cavenderia fasciculata]EGG20536.1 hypothetical protein DFA_00397 [Cavenderia fasciculata]|eukprot:XP_004358386.1 hypothetical protein DFA_00397 [Cavenderia fasciculata]